MWHPEPFVKHPIPATQPPTAGQAARSLWFTPLRSGRLELARPPGSALSSRGPGWTISRSPAGASSRTPSRLRWHGPAIPTPTFEQAERLLGEGAADIVASARQSLADPDWFRKLRLGLGEEVRRCVFTNYCEGLDQVHKPVTCKLWDHVGLDYTGTPLTPDGRRRLVAPAWEPAAP